MKAAYWTAVGAMAIPIGVVILIQWPNLDLLAISIMVVGLVSFVAGLAYTIREEHQKQKEYELRIKREKKSLKAIIFMADQLGVDIKERIP